MNKQKNFGIIGSSTVCILTFDHMTGVLQTANLGDSGFLLVRNKEVIKRSQKQTHTFNTPKVWFQSKSRDVFRDYVNQKLYKLIL